MEPQRKRVRCAIYTRKSSEEGLEQSFNSLDAQREACGSFIDSQRHEGWKALEARYDDGGYSGGSLERPGVKALLADIDAGKVDIVVVYKVDRLTRSLADFAKIVERFDAAKVSFVSVTQQFNTASSMGRLTLNVLLSFAQFEREVTGERIRDKVSASKKKGMWMGGAVPLGYRLADRKLVVDAKEAKIVRCIYEAYVRLRCVRKLAAELKALGVLSKKRVSKSGRRTGGIPYSRGALYSLLANRLYLGEVAHRGAVYAGEHQAIIERKLWERVQARLASNRSAKRNGTRAEEPSLLAGLLFDERGHRLTPSHCVTRGKRYRYYFSQALIGETPERATAVRRLPAAELERLVTKRYSTLLASSATVLEASSESEDDARTRSALVARAKELAAKLPKYSVPELREFALAVTTKIVVTELAVEITIAKGFLRRILLGLRKSDEVAAAKTAASAEDVVVLRIDARLRRCGSEVRLVIPPESACPAARVDRALVKAIARAHAWCAELISGHATSLGSIAKREVVHPRYVGRMIRCAFLAPDIVEAALEGRQPPTLSVEKLRFGVPLLWREQRKLLGFA